MSLPSPRTLAKALLLFPCSIVLASLNPSHYARQEPIGNNLLQTQTGQAIYDPFNTQITTQYTPNNTAASTQHSWKAGIPFLKTVLPELSGPAIAKVHALLKFKHEIDTINSDHTASTSTATPILETATPEANIATEAAYGENSYWHGGFNPDAQSRICTCFGAPPCCPKPWTLAANIDKQADDPTADAASPNASTDDSQAPEEALYRHGPFNPDTDNARFCSCYGAPPCCPKPWTLLAENTEKANNPQATEPQICTCFGRFAPCCPLPPLNSIVSPTEQAIVDEQQPLKDDKPTIQPHRRICSCFGTMPPCCPIPWLSSAIHEEAITDAEIAAAEKVLSFFKRDGGCYCYGGSGCCPASLKGCGVFGKSV